MSVTPLQRASLAWAARPPGPPAFWYAIGSTLRQLGGSLDAMGVEVQGDCATVEKRERNCLGPEPLSPCHMHENKHCSHTLSASSLLLRAVPIPSTAVKISGKAPAADSAGFVAPSANLIGAVKMGAGSSVWYSAMLKGSTASVELGELSSVGDRAVVEDSVVGKCVHIGAGAIVTGAKLADECSIGMGAKVGKGATIGSGAALAAGSVLPAGASVPAGELWGGIPAKKVSAIGVDAKEGMVRTCEVTAELAKIHMDEAWKDLALCEQEHEDYKRQETRTPERLSAMRDDPKWVPLPTLGEHLAKIGVQSNLHVPP